MKALNTASSYVVTHANGGMNGLSVLFTEAQKKIRNSYHQSTFAKLVARVMKIKVKYDHSRF